MDGRTPTIRQGKCVSRLDSLKEGFSWGFSGRSGFLDALKDQQFLEDSIHILRLEFHAIAGQVNTGELQRRLQDVEAGAKKLEQFITGNLGRNLLTRLPTNESAAKAQKVFETAELAEMILLKLSPPQINNASRVNRALSASLASSSKLQVKLHLRASHDCY